MSDSYVGEIRCFGFNFAPAGWQMCNGQLLSISQYAVLFTVIGTTYGGNGTTTFALPNLQTQVPMHWGAPGGGLPTTVLGQVQGQPNVTLTTAQLPAHTHAATAAKGAGTERTVAPGPTSYLAESIPGAAWVNPPTLGPQFAPNAISPAGSSIAHDNMQPYLVVNFCISLFGTFPPHS
jgi:microcystin-dependent protein